MKYIEKVLSHIGDRKRRLEIENELFDHLDEKEKFRQEIGYDSDVALAKSEEQMGDPDLVGEQLDSVKRKSGVLPIALLALTISALLSGFYINVLLPLGRTLLYSNEKLYTDLSPLFLFPFVSLCIIISCLGYFTGLKRKRRNLLIAGSITAAFSFLTAPYMLSDFIKTLTAKKHYNANYYAEGVKTYRLLFQKMNMLDFILCAVCVLVFIIAISFGLRYIQKTLRLENTKRDLKIKNALLSLTAVTIAGCLLLNCAFAFFAVKNADNAKEEISEYYLALEKKVLNGEITESKIRTEYRYGIKLLDVCQIGDFHKGEEYTAFALENNNVLNDYSADELSEEKFRTEYNNLSDAPAPRSMEYEKDSESTLVTLTYSVKEKLFSTYEISRLYRYDEKTDSFIYLDINEDS